jgi:cytochrome c5
VFAVLNRLVKTPLALLAGFAILFSAQQAFAQTDIEAITRNIQPIGRVCLVGQNCSGNDSASNSTAAAPVAQSAPAAPAVATPATPAVAEATTGFDVAATYQMSCFACHSSGAAGAPILGDADAWSERMAKGIDTVLANSINGVGAMPAKGMCMTCTEDDMRTLIDYMVSGGQ